MLHLPHTIREEAQCHTFIRAARLGAPFRDNRSFFPYLCENFFYDNFRSVAEQTSPTVSQNVSTERLMVFIYH